MKTDKLLHLIQQKQPKSTGRFLPLPKAQTGNQGLYDSLLKYEEKADLENFAELLDPTGISSWDDAVKAYDQYKKSKDRLPSGSQMLDMFSAAPGLGKLSYLRYLDPNGIKQLYKNFNWQKLLNTTDYFQDQYQNKDGGELHKFQARYSQVGIKPRTVTDLKNLLIYDQFDVENPILANRAGCVFDETGENCLASANRYFDKYVAPAAGIPNTWDLYEQLGVDQLKSLYNESIDSWDAHGVLQEKGATQLWAAKNENDWTNLSDEQKKQIYKKIPLGAFIGIGGVNPSHIAKDKGLAANKKRGLIPNRHSARVIGFTDDGIPLVYDYGKITPITKVLKDWPITNITVPTQYADYTYENVSKKYPRKTLDYNPDNTLKITSPAKGVSEGINQTEQLFIEGLNEAIPQLMQITGKSQQELNDYAKLAFGVLWNETSGGRSIVAAPKQFAATVREAFKGEPASKGLTRMKFTDLMNTPSFRTLADDLGINQLNFDLGSSSDPNDLKKQAAATLANLVRFKGDVPEGIDERYFRVQQHMAPYPSERSIEYMKNFDRGYSNSAINAASRVSDITGAGFPDLEAQIREAEGKRQLDEEKKAEDLQKQINAKTFTTPKLQDGGVNSDVPKDYIYKDGNITANYIGTSPHPYGVTNVPDSPCGPGFKIEYDATGNPVCMPIPEGDPQSGLNQPNVYQQDIPFSTQQYYPPQYYPPDLYSYINPLVVNEYYEDDDSTLLNKKRKRLRRKKEKDNTGLFDNMQPPRIGRFFKKFGRIIKDACTPGEDCPTFEEGGSLPKAQTNIEKKPWVDLPFGIEVANIFDKRFWQDEFDRIKEGNVFGDFYRSPIEPVSTQERLKEIRKNKKSDKPLPKAQTNIERNFYEKHIVPSYGFEKYHELKDKAYNDIFSNNSSKASDLMYLHDSDIFRDYGGLDDKADAWRHALTAYKTAQEYGFLPTNVLGLAHEMSSNGDDRPFKDRVQSSFSDIYNNFLGSAAGAIEPFAIAYMNRNGNRSNADLRKEYQKKFLDMVHVINKGTTGIKDDKPNKPTTKVRILKAK